VDYLRSKNYVCHVQVCIKKQNNHFKGRFERSVSNDSKYSGSTGPPSPRINTKPESSRKIGSFLNDKHDPSTENMNSGTTFNPNIQEYSHTQEFVFSSFNEQQEYEDTEIRQTEEPISNLEAVDVDFSTYQDATTIRGSERRKRTGKNGVMPDIGPYMHLLVGILS
jgi:hypothetical protein